jgi:cyclopropane fatty-acyl-phospholipid synthase-like methyltransferase
MRKFTESEKQLLIVVGWFQSRYGFMAGFNAESKSNHENLREFAKIWFGKYLVEWAKAYKKLLAEDLLSEKDGVFSLTKKGDSVRKTIETENPLWLYEYNKFFSQAVKSRTHAIFCKEVYGKNLCQHGLVDVFQLNKLLEVLKLNIQDRVLDLGCGIGLITEYLQIQTGAFFHGIDISEEAIKRASEITKKNNSLAFSIGNMNKLNFSEQSFDCVVSIDTFYYVKNLADTIKQIIPIIKPDGQMGVFYTQWINKTAERERCFPENTDLAEILKTYNLKFTTLDLTESEMDHWQKKVNTLEKLKPQFDKEGSMELYNYRYSEAKRYSNWDKEKHRRYLYHIIIK